MMVKVKQKFNQPRLEDFKKEIKKEVERRVSPIIEKGGYIPMIDHSVPPDVSLENYCYFQGIYIINKNNYLKHGIRRHYAGLS